MKNTKIALLVAGLIASSSSFAAIVDLSTTAGLLSYDIGLGSYNLGSNATTTANNAVALGANSSVSEQSSIAIGYGSIANVANTISFGAGNINIYNAPLTRTLTNISAGVNATDAVNMGQLITIQSNATTNTANIATNTIDIATNATNLVTTNGLVATNTANIATNASDIIKLNDLMGGTQTQINGLQNQVTQNNRIALQGIAGVAAMSGLPALEMGKRFNLGMSVGNYKSESAIAFGAQARIADNIVAKASIGASGSNYTSSVGVGISW